MTLTQIIFDLSCGVAGYFALGVAEAVGAGLWWLWCLFMNKRNHGGWRASGGRLTGAGRIVAER